MSELPNRVRAIVSLPRLCPRLNRDFGFVGYQIFPGRQVAQGVMWSFFVVLHEPLLSLLSDFIQTLKHKHIEHRFAIATIEALDKTILHGPSWSDELERHTMLLSPFRQRH